MILAVYIVVQVLWPVVGREALIAWSVIMLFMIVYRAAITLAYFQRRSVRHEIRDAAGTREIAGRMGDIPAIQDVAGPEGLTVIAGENNCGKSAIVTAIQCVCFNATGNYMVRHGEKECRVIVETDDGHVVDHG